MDEFKNKIIQGDTLVSLKNIPNNIIDLGITSPPYNKKEKQKGWLVKNVKYDSISDKMPEEMYQKNQIEVLDQLFRITKEGGSFFYNHKIRWEEGRMIHPLEWIMKTDWCLRQEIVWDRMIAANIRGWRFWQVEERIYWLYKPKNNNLIGEELRSNHSLMTSIWRFSPEKNNPHPAPFPIDLPTRIIYSLLDEQKDKLIIDPYSGSGTTLLASKLLGHNYIGIDISDDYINLSKERIQKNQEKDIIRFYKEIELHKVNKTFKERKDKKEFVGKFRKINEENNQLSIF